MNEGMVFVVPVDNQVVRFPGSMARLPEAGAWVPWVGSESTFWKKRLADNSIKIIEKSESKSVPGTVYVGPKKNEQGGK